MRITGAKKTPTRPVPNLCTIKSRTTIAQEIPTMAPAAKAASYDSTCVDEAMIYTIAPQENHLLSTSYTGAEWPHQINAEFRHTGCTNGCMPWSTVLLCCSSKAPFHDHSRHTHLETLKSSLASHIWLQGLPAQVSRLHPPGPYLSLAAQGTASWPVRLL